MDLVADLLQDRRGAHGGEDAGRHDILLRDADLAAAARASSQVLAVGLQGGVSVCPKLRSCRKRENASLAWTGCPAASCMPSRHDQCIARVLVEQLVRLDVQRVGGGSQTSG